MNKPSKIATYGAALIFLLGGTAYAADKKTKPAEIKEYSTEGFDRNTIKDYSFQKSALLFLKSIGYSEEEISKFVVGFDYTWGKLDKGVLSKEIAQYVLANKKEICKLTKQAINREVEFNKNRMNQFYEENLEKIKDIKSPQTTIIDYLKINEINRKDLDKKLDKSDIEKKVEEEYRNILDSKSSKNNNFKAEQAMNYYELALKIIDQKRDQIEFIYSNSEDKLKKKYEKFLKELKTTRKDYLKDIDVLAKYENQLVDNIEKMVEIDIINNTDATRDKLYNQALKNVINLSKRISETKTAMNAANEKYNKQMQELTDSYSKSSESLVNRNQERAQRVIKGMEELLKQNYNQAIELIQMQGEE